MEEFVNYLTSPYLGYTRVQIYLEILAALLGVVSVIFAMYKNILVYPTGIISTAIYVYLLFNWSLYGDMIINFYYFSMSIYGWIIWMKKDENNDYIPITFIFKKEYGYLILIFIFSIIGVLTVYYFKPYIESNFNNYQLSHLKFSYNSIQYIDSITTGIFFVGMWLLARKKLENWVFWIVGDVISVPLYIVKGYAITALQYFIFLILASIGLRIWLKTIRSQKALD